MKKALPAALKAHQFKKSSGDLGKGKPAASAPKASSPIGAGNSSHIDNFAKKYGNGMNPGRSK